MSKKYINIVQAAAFLGCSATWIKKLIAASRLPAIKTGDRTVLIPLLVLRRLASERRQRRLAAL